MTLALVRCAPRWGRWSGCCPVALVVGDETSGVRGQAGEVGAASVEAVLGDLAVGADCPDHELGVVYGDNDTGVRSVGCGCCCVGDGGQVHDQAPGSGDAPADRGC